MKINIRFRIATSLSQHWQALVSNPLVALVEKTSLDKRFDSLNHDLRKSRQAIRLSETIKDLACSSDRPMQKTIVPYLGVHQLANCIEHLPLSTFVHGCRAEGTSNINSSSFLTNSVEEILHVLGFVPSCRDPLKSQGSPESTSRWAALLGLPDLVFLCHGSVAGWKYYLSSDPARPSSWRRRRDRPRTTSADLEIASRGTFIKAAAPAYLARRTWIVRDQLSPALLPAC